MIVPSLDVEAFDYVSAKLLPPPSHNVFFPGGISGQNFHFFLSVCMVKMELKVVFGDVTSILDIFQKRGLVHRTLGDVIVGVWPWLEACTIIVWWKQI